MIPPIAHQGKPLRVGAGDRAATARICDPPSWSETRRMSTMILSSRRRASSDSASAACVCAICPFRRSFSSRRTAISMCFFKHVPCLCAMRRAEPESLCRSDNSIPQAAAGRCLQDEQGANPIPRTRPRTWQAIGHTTADFIELQTGTILPASAVDTLKPHCCWGPADRACRAGPSEAARRPPSAPPAGDSVDLEKTFRHRQAAKPIGLVRAAD